MGGVLVFAGLVAATLGSEIQIEAEGGGDCPRREVLAGELAARMRGGAVGDGQREGGGWRLRYRSGGAEARSGRREIAIELVDAAGQTRLRRNLTVERGECRVTAATAIAAIVERFFRGIGWTGGAPLPSPSPAPVPAPVTPAVVTPAPRPAAPPPPPPRPPAAAPAPAPAPSVARAPAAATTATATTSAAAAAPAVRRVGAGVTVGAGPTVWLAEQPLLRAGLAVRGELAALPVALGIGVLLPGARSAQRPQGQALAAQTSWPLRLTLLALLRRPGWELDGGPDLVATLDSATSTGITEPAADTRVSIAAGLAAGAALRLAGGWQVHAGAAAHRHLAGNRFFIETTAGQRLFVLDRPRWQGLVTLALAYRFWL